MKQIPCPQCKKPVDLTKKSSYRPFCSDRCRLIDLGAWANEDYQIVGKPPLEELSDPGSEFRTESDETGDWASGKLH